MKFRFLALTTLTVLLVTGCGTTQPRGVSSSTRISPDLGVGTTTSIAEISNELRPGYQAVSPDGKTVARVEGDDFEKRIVIATHPGGKGQLLKHMDSIPDGVYALIWMPGPDALIVVEGCERGRNGRGRAWKVATRGFGGWAIPEEPLGIAWDCGMPPLEITPRGATAVHFRFGTTDYYDLVEVPHGTRPKPPKYYIDSFDYDVKTGRKSNQSRKQAPGSGYLP